MDCGNLMACCQRGDLLAAGSQGRIDVDGQRPTLTGSSPITKTTGIVLVAALAAKAAGNVIVAMAFGPRPIRSAANPGSRSIWPFAQRDSKATLVPSRRPPSSKPLRNAVSTPA